MKNYTNSALKNQMSTGVKFLAPFILLLILSCGGVRNSSSLESEKDFARISELVENREFEIENEWLLPLGGSMINLIGNPNYIRFKGDSVSLYLPYFGVRHSGGAYGRDGGISYEGPPKNLSITKDTAKNNIHLNFEANADSETLEFFITLFQGGSATTFVSSSQRQSISYRGDVKELPEEKQ